MKYTVTITKNGHVREFPCKSKRAVQSLLDGMMNKEREITIRPFKPAPPGPPTVVQMRQVA